MFLSAYRFAGDPAELLPAYDRLMASIPAGNVTLHVCVVEEDAITMFDTCPTREVFVAFSSGPGFIAALEAAGLPKPTIQPIGTVYASRALEADGK